MTDFYKYWLASLCGPSDRMKRMFCEFFGSAKGLYYARAEEIQAVHYPYERTPRREFFYQGRNEEKLKEEWKRFNESKVSLVTLEDPEYPKLLAQVSDSPYGIFYIGRIPSQLEHCVAMVGSRRASEYGKCMTEEIARCLALSGISVISGMARGIDAASHRGALWGGGKTYAVLGCGADICYPRQNLSLYREIIENGGGILSEYVPGTEARPEFFPARNRIISGLSREVLVMEARERSGSLITADFALEQGRDVFSLPGRITDSASAGCNHLIDQGAGIICSSEQMVKTITGETSEVSDKKATGEVFCLEKEELLVYSCFDFCAKGLEQVHDESGLDILQLMMIVNKLCALGVLKETFKNMYVRTGRAVK